jgi:bifunctional DNA-binding transcriptional regulator/antitoxin component of YhaV-PrlF toxin-antitoxin module
VKFQAKLQKGGRVQVPRLVRWRFKLESYQIFEVTVMVVGAWGGFQSFLARMSKDGRIVIPKQTLGLLRQKQFKIEGRVLDVTLAPS